MWFWRRSALRECSDHGLVSDDVIGAAIKRYMRFGRSRDIGDGGDIISHYPLSEYSDDGDDVDDDGFNHYNVEQKRYMRFGRR